MKTEVRVMSYKLTEKPEKSERKADMSSFINTIIHDAFRRGDRLSFRHVADIEEAFFDAVDDNLIPVHMTHELESMMNDLYDYATEVDRRRCR